MSPTWIFSTSRMERGKLNVLPEWSSGVSRLYETPLLRSP